MYFPSLCIDNFYERPDEVRDIAESMVYKRKTQENFWPGKRTENIGEIDKSLHHETCTKILSIFYPFQLENFRAIQFRASSFFQKIEKFNSKINTGWIHRDAPNVLSCVIYLSKKSMNGTSIYRPKKSFTKDIHKEINSSVIHGNKNISEKHINALKENNDQFEQVVNFKGIYNRAVIFDAAQWHAANGFGNEEEERLTMIVFFHEIFVPYFPIPNCNTVI